MLNTNERYSTLTGLGFSRFIFLTILLSLLNSPAMAACNCKEQPLLPVGVCSVNLEVCGCLKKMDWQYSAEAEEDQSGKTGNSSGNDNPDDAINDAISALFKENPELASKCFPS